MDNLGYKNWGGSGYQDDSYESSHNKYKYGSKKEESFDYDISSDFADSPVHTTQKRGKGSAPEPVAASATRFGGITRSRSSIDDRTKEILERNKAVGKSSVNEGDQNRLKSYQDTFAELMEGIDYKEKEPEPAKQYSGSKGMSKSNNMSSELLSPRSLADSSVGSRSMGDSFEISAADLEVHMPVLIGVFFIRSFAYFNVLSNRPFYLGGCFGSSESKRKGF
jgi:hypothetical protein